MREYRANLGGGDLDEAVANCAGGVREMVRLMPDVFVVGTQGAYDADGGEEGRKWREEMYVYPVTAAMRQRRPPGWGIDSICPAKCFDSLTKSKDY